MIDLAEVTKRQQKVWATRDFAQIATRFTIVGELLCETVDVRPGERVLDVAAGSGTALAVARRRCEVTASDFVPELLEAAQRRAECQGLTIETRVSDVQERGTAPATARSSPRPSPSRWSPSWPNRAAEASALARSIWSHAGPVVPRRRVRVFRAARRLCGPAPAGPSSPAVPPAAAALESTPGPARGSALARA